MIHWKHSTWLSCALHCNSEQKHNTDKLLTKQTVMQSQYCQCSVTCISKMQKQKTLESPWAIDSNSSVQKLKRWLNNTQKCCNSKQYVLYWTQSRKTIKTMSSKDKADRNRSYGLQSPRSATLHKYNRDSNNADVGQSAPANPASSHL